MAAASSFRAATRFLNRTQTAEFAGVGGPGYEIPRERNKLTHQNW
jgi:hypothetical protein